MAVQKYALFNDRYKFTLLQCNENFNVTHRCTKNQYMQLTFSDLQHEHPSLGGFPLHVVNESRSHNVINPLSFPHSQWTRGDAQSMLLWAQLVSMDR